MSRYLAGMLLIAMPITFSSCSLKLFSGRKHKKKDAVTAQQNPADSVQTQVTTTPPPKADTVVPHTDAMNQLMSDLLPIFAKRIPFTTFSGKAKVSFEDPDGSKDFTANFRVKKDSVIWIQITVLGGAYSAARIFVTNDSFFMINYVDKEVTRIALKDAAKTLPTAVDFAQLQNLIVGDPLREGQITEASEQQAMWNITVEDSNYIQHLSYTKTDSTMSAGQMATRKPGGPTAMIDYADYNPTDNRKLATKRSVHVRNGDKNYTIDMNFTSAQFDKPLDYPFSIPKNYSMKNPK